VLWIKNTLELTELACSAAYQEAAQQRDDLEILSSPSSWPFDKEGNLPRTVHNWQ
jgi:hypothetical protein